MPKKARVGCPPPNILLCENGEMLVNVIEVDVRDNTEKSRDESDKGTTA